MSRRKFDAANTWVASPGIAAVPGAGTPFWAVRCISPWKPAVKWGKESGGAAAAEDASSMTRDRASTVSMLGRARLVRALAVCAPTAATM